MQESKRERYIRLLKSKSKLDFVKLFFDEVKDIIELLEEPMQQWIPCKDRLPEQGVDVFVAWINGVDIAHWDIGENGRYWNFEVFYLGECDGEFADVIAWMPLPMPYLEDNDEN